MSIAQSHHRAELGSGAVLRVFNEPPHENYRYTRPKGHGQANEVEPKCQQVVQILSAVNENLSCVQRTSGVPVLSVYYLPVSIDFFLSTSFSVAPVTPANIEISIQYPGTHSRVSKFCCYKNLKKLLKFPQNFHKMSVKCL